MEPVRCPRCSRVAAVKVGTPTMVAQFHQPGMPWVGFESPFHACLVCGLVWSTTDPNRLRAGIATYGDELARQELDEIDRGPFRDLPDTDLGREIGAAIAELNALARQGSSALSRRYRELRGVTWDEALRETREWARMTHQQKLALFGWSPKKKPALDDFDEPMF